MQQYSVGVVGGGAAGMTAAITAARLGAEVTILERGERVGKKILSTGNGKCNLGNTVLNAECYHVADKVWLEECLRQFGTEDTISFFHSLGLMIKEKNGYLYPACEQASVVLDVLRAEIKYLGIRLVTGCKVEHIKQTEKGFCILAGKEVFYFDRVILACGGRAAPGTGSDGKGFALAGELGHRLVPDVPALVQLKCREDYFKAVAGVRTEAVIRILGCPDKEKPAERGELQLTDYGISGIPVFQISREVNYILMRSGKGAEAEVSIDLLPEFDEERYRRFVQERKERFGDRTVEEFFTGMLHKKLMHLFIKLAGLKQDQAVPEVKESQIDKVFSLCRDWRVHVTGSNSYESAQVSAGGVDTAQVGIHMESKLVPGLFFAGEILDVDGRCGGYNLQWAWCSASLAGRAAAGQTAERHAAAEQAATDRQPRKRL